MNVHPLMVLVVTLLERAEQRRLAALGHRDELVAAFTRQTVDDVMLELRECNPTIH